MTFRDKANKSMLRKSSKKLSSAKDDFSNGRYDSCVSNLYYAAFQTVCALLIIRQEYANKHTHVRAYVNKELAYKGLISLDLAKSFNKLMDSRSDAGYNYESFFYREIALGFLVGVEQFNSAIQKIIDAERKQLS